MSGFFLDSSAIVKRFVAETGSAWVTNITDPESGNRLYVARIAGPEVVAAFSRRVRIGHLSPSDARIAIDEFRAEFTRSYIKVNLVVSLLDEAMDVAERYQLRGYDSVQLAASLRANAAGVARGDGPVTVVTADVELIASAVAEGLAVEDPNTQV